MSSKYSAVLLMNGILIIGRPEDDPVGVRIYEAVIALGFGGPKMSFMVAPAKDGRVSILKYENIAFTFEPDDSLMNGYAQARSKAKGLGSPVPDSTKNPEILA